MNNGKIEALRPLIPQVGSFVSVRGKTWIIESSEKRAGLSVCRRCQLRQSRRSRW
jgi:hypothetical protein